MSKPVIISLRSAKFLVSHFPRCLAGLIFRFHWPTLKARGQFLRTRTFTPFFTPCGYYVVTVQELVCYWELHWEAGLFKSWSRDCKGSPLILDIGANYGLFAWECRKRWPGSEIIGFEPHPVLSAKCSSLGIYNQVYDLALHRSEGFVTLYMSTDDGGYTGNTGGSEIYRYSAEEYTVKSIRLDTLQLSPDIVKIDVDGSELEVLSGGLETIRKARHVIIECADKPRADAVADLLGRKYQKLTANDYLFELPCPS